MTESFDENINILVVEDDRSLLEAIGIKLKNNNFIVETARTVEEAMKLLKNNNSINVIWLDHYLLGKESGLDFVIKIKNEGELWSKIPIFIVSNTASPEKVDSYLHLGVSKYYVKAEHRLDAIIEDIKNLLKSSSKNIKK